MKTAAIICEYNPFHMGHKYQIEATRRVGATHIVCIMSGDIVQRGELALYSKHDRAEMALANGADLVIELPSPYSCGTAGDFARAGVQLARGMGCVDLLSFGAECEDTARLVECARALKNAESIDLSDYLTAGLTYPQALSKAIGEEYSELLLGANNTLALEYIKNLLDSDIKPIAIKRTTPHDGEAPTDSYASASYIRGKILSGESVDGLVSCRLPATPARMKTVENALIFRLLAMSSEEISQAPYMSDGVAQRIFEALKAATTLEDIYTFAKTKNVTHARVRRAVLLAALGVKAEDMSRPAAYGRILACNSRGREVLTRSKATASIALSAALASLESLGEEAKRQARLEVLCSQLRAMAAGEAWQNEYTRKFTVKW